MFIGTPLPPPVPLASSSCPQISSSSIVNSNRRSVGDLLPPPPPPPSLPLPVKYVTENQDFHLPSNTSKHQSYYDKSLSFFSSENQYKMER